MQQSQPPSWDSCRALPFDALADNALCSLCPACACRGCPSAMCRPARSCPSIRASLGRTTTLLLRRWCLWSLRCRPLPHRHRQPAQQCGLPCSLGQRLLRRWQQQAQGRLHRGLCLAWACCQAGQGQSQSRSLRLGPCRGLHQVRPCLLTLLQAEHQGLLCMQKGWGLRSLGLWCSA